MGSQATGDRSTELTPQVATRWMLHYFTPKLRAHPLEVWWKKKDACEGTKVRCVSLSRLILNVQVDDLTRVAGWVTRRTR